MFSKVVRRIDSSKSEESLVTLEYISKVNLSSYHLLNFQFLPNHQLHYIASIKYLKFLNMAYATNLLTMYINCILKD